MSDPDRPSTWVPYRESLCEGCRAGCCRLPVEVSTQDLLRMGVVTAEESGGSLKRVARRLEREGVVQAFHAASRSFTLQQRPTSDPRKLECVYLGVDRRCTIYERRPEVCRAFPAIGPRPGYCPADHA